MSDPDPKTALREFREYFARSYEANHKIAARIGVTVKTFAEWLTGDCQPMGTSLEKLRKFLDAEAKRNTRDGIRPIEHVPLKIVWPRRQLHYARLCPFCRKVFAVEFGHFPRNNSRVSVRSAERRDQSERATRMRCGRGMGENKTIAERTPWQLRFQAYA